MTLVGIISDTHGRLDTAAATAMAAADRIIHAGDIGDPRILHELEALAPTTAVLGNNDYDEYGSHVGPRACPVIDGVRFLVAHYPHDVRIGFGGAKLEPGEPIPRVCVHGHTHTPRLDTGAAARPADYMICPGSASRPRSGMSRSVGFVHVHDGHVLGVRIETLRGAVIMQTGEMW
ncbi:metallophosphoesterase family protein [Adlercreutzia sp. ZJ141]|uniref:metallophosphoesterase family protein n=1 Tax=Adlercreutzia sp. ZJ141 TaxID=2709406 RepID=UPI0013ECE2DB|nr:metallophosphoesterase family protein [Adlercreutzia sp. ZJ141]